MQILATEPTNFIQGQSIAWKKYIVDYPPSEGFVLSYGFRKIDDGFNVKATTAKDHYFVSLASEDTANYKAGVYSWQAIIAAKEELYIVASGKLTIEPNLLFTKNYDGRSHVKQVLDALEATILNKASRDQLSYSISGRSLSRLNPGELLKWRDIYRAEYARELQQERLSQGLNINNSIKIRFTNPL